MVQLGYVKALLVGKSVAYSRGTESAISKVPQYGRLALTKEGFVGDEVGDRRFHGGAEKAIHIYPSEHYEKWLEELGDRELFQQPGAFGENLSSSGVTENSICIGDEIQIGSALLQVSQGRMPCWKLNDRCGQPDMSLRLQMTLRTGWYFRVLNEGELGKGDDLKLVSRGYPDWPISRIMRNIYQGTLDTNELQHMLCLPLVESWRNLVNLRIETGVVENWSARLFGRRSYRS